MKKIIILLSLLTLALSANSFSAYAENTVFERPNIKIVINSKKVNLTSSPIIVNEKTLLPLRTILNKLGVSNDDKHIIWNDKDKSILVIKDKKRIKLQVSSDMAYINSNPVKLDVAPVIYNGNTYIPVKFVSQSLGKKVIWDDNTNTILICEEKAFNDVKAAFDKSDLTMQAVNYTLTGSINLIIGNVLKSTSTRLEEIDNKNKISYERSTDVDTNLIKNETTTSTEETYYIKDTKYYKSSANEKWSKQIMTGKEIESKFGISKMENEDAVVAGLSIIPSTNLDEIIIEGDFVLGGSFDDSKEDDSIKPHTKIVIDKKNYFVKEITFEISGRTNIGGSMFQYYTKAEIKNNEQDNNYRINIPTDLK